MKTFSRFLAAYTALICIVSISACNNQTNNLEISPKQEDRARNPDLEKLDKIIADNKRRESASPYIESGIKKRELNDAQGAIADFKKALQIHPESSEAYWQTAIAKNNLLKDYKGALADYNKTIELAPKYGWAYFNRGNLKYRIFKDIAGAKADFAKADQIATEQRDSRLSDVLFPILLNMPKK